MRPVEEYAVRCSSSSVMTRRGSVTVRCPARVFVGPSTIPAPLTSMTFREIVTVRRSTSRSLHRRASQLADAGAAVAPQPDQRSVPGTNLAHGVRQRLHLSRREVHVLRLGDRGQRDFRLSVAMRKSPLAAR